MNRHDGHHKYDSSGKLVQTDIFGVLTRLYSNHVEHIQDWSLYSNCMLYLLQSVFSYGLNLAVPEKSFSDNGSLIVFSNKSSQNKWLKQCGHFSCLIRGKRKPN